MARKEKIYEDDDGRTIVSMDVEGMPWHDKRVRAEERERRKQAFKEMEDRGEILTKRQTARVVLHALLGALAVVLFIGGGIVLLIFIEWCIWKAKKGA